MRRVRFYVCFFSVERHHSEWVGVKVKKRKRPEVAAHLGIGSGAESRDRGQGKVCGLAE